MSEGPAITLGSVVRLKSGGPKMTVTWVNPSSSVPAEVTCRWCLEGQTESNAITLPIAALELCADEPKQLGEPVGHLDHDAEFWEKDADRHAVAQHEAEALVAELRGAITKQNDDAWKFAAQRDEAKACVQRLAGALTELIEDVSDAEHLPHDWSEQVCIRNAKTALASVPAHLLAKEPSAGPTHTEATPEPPNAR